MERDHRQGQLDPTAELARRVVPCRVGLHPLVVFGLWSVLSPAYVASSVVVTPWSDLGPVAFAAILLRGTSIVALPALLWLATRLVSRRAELELTGPSARVVAGDHALAEGGWRLHTESLGWTQVRVSGTRVWARSRAIGLSAQPAASS